MILQQQVVAPQACNLRCESLQPGNSRLTQPNWVDAETVALSQSQLYVQSETAVIRHELSDGEESAQTLPLAGMFWETSMRQHVQKT